MAVTQEFTDFTSLLANSERPLLVVFSAAWSGPSRLMDTILEEVQAQIQALQIVKIDSETYPELASRYEIHPLPTLLLFKRGQLVAKIEEERTECLMPADKLIQRLQSFL
jgi:thioredoxin-like negative regulator of GroEL